MKNSVGDIETYVILLEGQRLAKEAVDSFEKTHEKIGQDYFVRQTQLQIFDKFPEVQSFSWKQGAPSWNDGDPCYFSVHAYTEDIKINGWYYDLGDSEAEENDVKKIVNFDDVGHVINKFIDSHTDEFMERTFGDGVEVTIERGGVVGIDGAEF